jgi:hypothetical protein
MSRAAFDAAHERLRLHWLDSESSLRINTPA